MKLALLPRLITSCLFLVFFIYTSLPVLGGWIRKPQSAMPLNFGSNILGQSFTIGEKGYIIGTTTNSSKPTTQSFWSWDQTFEIWTQLPDFPGQGISGGIESKNISSFVIGNRAFVTGTNSSLYIWDGTSWSLANCAGPLAPSTLAAARGFTIGTKGYLVSGINSYSGGYSSGYGRWVWEFDEAKYNLNQNPWRALAVAPSAYNPRQLVAGFVLNNKIYVGGGIPEIVNVNGALAYTDFWEFDPAVGSLGTWTKKSDIPYQGSNDIFGNQGRVDCATFSICNKGYICLGGTRVSGPAHSTSLHMYDPVIDHWFVKTSFPSYERYGVASFSIGGRGYVTMGSTDSSPLQYSDPYYLDYAFYPTDLWEYTPDVATVGPYSNVFVTDPSFPLTGGSPVGGVYSGFGLTATGVFEPFRAGLGTHTIIYTVNDGCTASSDTTTITVVCPTASLAPFAPVNVAHPSFVLTGGLPVGGIYSGPGVSNGTFSPATAGVGTHTITYVPFAGCPPVTNTITVEVNCSELSISPYHSIYGLYTDPSNTVQSYTAPFALTGASPAGGDYTGPGVSDGVFYPLLAGNGTHTITYTLGPCAVSTTLTVVGCEMNYNYPENDPEAYIFYRCLNKIITTDDIASKTFCAGQDAIMPFTYLNLFDGFSSLALDRTYKAYLMNAAGTAIVGSAIGTLFIPNGNPLDAVSIPIQIPSGTSAGTYKIRVDCITDNVVGIPSQYTITVTGPCNYKALAYDGVNDVSTIPAHTNYNVGTGAFTIEAWVKMSSIQNSLKPTVLSRGSAADASGFALSTQNAGTQLVMRFGTSTLFESPSFPSIHDDQCHLIAVTRSGTSLTYYVDGVAYPAPGGVSATRSISGGTNGGGSLLIGNDHNNTNPFKGEIHELRFWIIERTGTQISSNFSTVFNTSNTNLKGYWRMRELNGQVLDDASVTNNDLGVLGTTSSVENTDPVRIASSCHSNDRLADNGEEAVEELLQGGVHLYPNPFEHTLHVLALAESEEEWMQVDIMDIQGRTVYQGKLNTQEKHALSLDVPNGMYLVLVSCGNQVFRYKVVKSN